MKTNFTAYRKYKLTDDLSIRYFYQFETKPEYTDKWVIKSHERKEYSIISQYTAELILESHGLSMHDYKHIAGLVDSCGIYSKYTLASIPIEL